MSRWDRQPVPDRQWAIRDRVPLSQAGLFSGEGGTGKSIIELMKNVACGIRVNAATDSEGKRPPIPRESGHAIRSKAATLLIG